MTRINLISFGLEVKTVDTAKGTFTRLGAAFGNLDAYNDVIERGAFANTLSEAKAIKSANRSPVLYPLLWMHEAAQPCGIISDAYETADGLVIECQCDLDTELGRMAFSGAQKGYADGLSIGYQTVRATRDAKGNRHLLEVKLAEVSVITRGYAANPHAMVDRASIKSRSGAGSDRYEEWMNQRLFRSAPKPAPASAYSTPAPRMEDYPTEAKYVKAFWDWYTKGSDGNVYERAKLVVREEGDPEEVGYQDVPFTSKAELRAAITQQQDQRAMLPGASLADVRAHYARHGQTPDGRRLNQSSAIDADAYYRSVQERIDAEKGR